MVHRGSPDHSVDVVSIRTSVAQTLEEDRTDPVGWDVSAASVAKAVAAAVLRDEPEHGQSRHLGGMEEKVDAPGHCGIRATGAQVGARRVQRGERGGARGVHGDTGALQVQVVRDAIGRGIVLGVHRHQSSACQLLRAEQGVILE